ncbi:MAG: SGNH/GDSL hydrolase family protein, partial [Puniceicoccales bacterium]
VFIYLTVILGLLVHGPLLAGDNTDLPRVLIIGDSISIGYTPYVEEALDGKAEVIHHPGNAMHTRNGLKKLHRWLGEEKWDVIHFNWGMWDLCYRHHDQRMSQQNRDKVNGTITTSIEEYENNLDELVTRLEKTGAVLIWANTTAVPAEEPGRIHGDDHRYNATAEAVMRKHGVRINDLNTLTHAFEGKEALPVDDVHYSQAGYRAIGEQVAVFIESALNESRARDVAAN